ncbi:A/G-specific adenine glycosylase [Inediibacterium massiliense]|uniref:A/G-specific adenine glycosylase n=1 Tax=Inediibacterium massiliense TaxID=1658111 RepID=UPI0006B45748|nr:A/G-specific adenine glycosylase [Inediibacterium massiliense]
MSFYKFGDYENVSSKVIKEIQINLIDWYMKNHRKLPWRENQNPYYIWISEVMLQQTRVETVIPYFLNFINKFPNIKALANANEEDVLKAWEGLGYYSRAKNLHRGAKMICDEFLGLIPKNQKEIQKIIGIGPYTAGAILSIAYDQPVPAVDGNVMRVFSRLFYIKEDIGANKTRKEMERLGEVLVSRENPSFFNQALMELGAMICIPKNPKCIACPLFSQCMGRKLGVQHTLPIKNKKIKKREVNLEVALLWNENKFFIVKRSSQGLLANLWALPSVEREKNIEEGKTIILELEENYGMIVEKEKFLFQKEHIFTHLKWNMKVYLYKLIKSSIVEYPENGWIDKEEIEKYTFPTAFMKILKEIKKLV